MSLQRLHLLLSRSESVSQENETLLDLQEVPSLSALGQNPFSPQAGPHSFFGVIISFF